MPTALLAYANRISTGNATLTATGSFEPTLPLTNLMDRRLGKVARRAPGAGTYIVTADLGGARRCRVAALMNFNPTVRDEAGVGGVVNTINAQIMASNISPGGFEIYSGSFTLDDLGLAEIPSNIYIPLPTVITARYWRFDFSWTNPFGRTRQAGVLWLSDAIEIGGETGRGVDAEWTQNIIDPTPVRRSRSQQVYTDDRPKYAELTARSSLENRRRIYGDITESFRNAFQTAFYRNGGTREVILMPQVPDEVWGTTGLNPTKEALQLVNRTAIYGLMPSANQLQRGRGEYYGVPLKVTGVR